MLKSICLLWIVLLVNHVNAHDEFNRLTLEKELVVKQVTIEQGLSTSVVNHFAQSPNGYIWVGTQGGVDRFDGYEFLAFRQQPGNPNSLHGSEIGHLFADKEGYVWVSNYNGVSRIDSRTNQVVRLSIEGVEGPVDIHEVTQDDIYGRIWMATRRGIFVFDEGLERFRRYNQIIQDAPKLPEGTISAIHPVGSMIYFFSGDCLHRLNLIKKEVTDKCQLKQSDGSLIGKVKVIESNGQDKLWLGGDTFSEFSILTESLTGFSDSTNQVLSELGLIEDLKLSSIGELWIASSKGVGRFSPRNQTIQRFTKNLIDKHRLAEDYVMSVFEDREGSIWIGTYGGGFYITNPRAKPFSHILTRNHANQFDITNLVHAVVSDATDNLWIGTFGSGLFQVPREQNSIQRINPVDSRATLSDKFIISLYIDIYGKLWIGHEEGIMLFDPDTGKLVEASSTQYMPEYGQANKIIEDRSGSIWIGSLNGLFEVKNYRGRLDEFAEVNFVNHLDEINQQLGDTANVTEIYKDTFGKLWLGLYTGLACFDLDTGKLDFFSHDEKNPKSISSNLVHKVYEDPKGNLWIGTAHGLNRMEINRENLSLSYFTRYETKDGIPNDAIYAIVADSRSEQLWLSTDFGVVLYDHVNRTGEHFTWGDGLQNNEFNLYADHVTNTGDIILGGINGVTRFSPSQVIVQDKSYPLRVTELKVNNIALSPKEIARGEVRLEESSVMSIRVAALNFTSPEKQRYRYRIGDDTAPWVSLGNTRQLTISGIEKGRQTITLSTTDSSGDWQTQELQLVLEVNASIWFSTLAIWLYLIGSLLVLIALFVWLQKHHQAKLLVLIDELEYRKKEIRDKTSELNQAQDQLTRQFQEKSRLNEELQLQQRKLVDVSRRDMISGFYKKRFFEELVTKEDQLIEVEGSAYPEGCMVGLFIENYAQYQLTEDIANLEAAFSDFSEFIRNYFAGDDLICRWDENKIILLESGNVEVVSLRMQNLLRILNSRAFDSGNGRLLQFSCLITLIPVPMANSSNVTSNRIQAGYLTSDLCDYLFAANAAGCYVFRCVDEIHPASLEKHISEGVEYLLEQKMFELHSVAEQQLETHE